MRLVPWDKLWLYRNAPVFFVRARVFDDRCWHEENGCPVNAW